MFYSKSSGFYSRQLHCAAIPSDAVELTDAQYRALLDGQAAGKRIVAGADGKPVLADPPAPTADQLAVQARARRDALVGSTDWVIARHRDQVETGVKTSLSGAQYTELMQYRQALRDVPAQKGFPSSIAWPAPPSWLAALPQS
ncbi:phage tail assembly chaperone [Paludibacterium paludis]|uniref:Phage tail assembly chaperone-like domain-containing protein n=1 Tax=Paludibacterium paludis TaxID=1225769 RepID=A0A918NYG6_9NEIS|nr:phage tail assembly chaperone [Paludibacterium paludis]GGY07019.1 hypothetical protein GCM10011289_07020 [Paludibacterium paludis]